MRCMASLGANAQLRTDRSDGGWHDRVSLASVTRSMLRHLPNIICLVRIALIWPTIDAL